MKSILTLLLGLLLFSALHAQVPSYVPTDGLVGWWPFNGNANDESGNGNDGVVNGATLTEDRFGNPASAYNFNLGQSISKAIVNYDDFTVTIWAKLYSFDACNGTSPTASSIVSHKDNGNYGNGFGINQVSQQWSYLEYNSNVNYIQYNVGSCLLGNWYQLSYVSEFGGTRRFYVNGELIDEYSGPQIVIPGNLYDFKIGSFNDAPTSCSCVGDLDDVGYWNRALTEQ